MFSSIWKVWHAQAVSLKLKQNSELLLLNVTCLLSTTCAHIKYYRNPAMAEEPRGQKDFALKFYEGKHWVGTLKNEEERVVFHAKYLLDVILNTTKSYQSISMHMRVMMCPSSTCKTHEGKGTITERKRELSSCTRHIFLTT